MVIPLNRVYCKHSIYHKTPYNESGGESKFPKEDEKNLAAAIQLPSQFLYIHPCHFFGQNDSLSFCSSVKAFRQEQVTIMPKRLIAMKLFMKERFLILKILDISHKIAEFIEEVNHHATIASRLGSCPFSGISMAFMA